MAKTYSLLENKSFLNSQKAKLFDDHQKCKAFPRHQKSTISEVTFVAFILKVARDRGNSK